MAAHQVLFCPFCRESFEELSRCPEHELRLVRFDELKGMAHELAAEEDPFLEPLDQPLAAFDPRFGRGPVLCGALLALAAMAVDVARLSGAAGGLSFGRALTAAPSLGTLPLVSFTLLWVLGRRRTRRALLGVRLLVPFLGMLYPAAFAYGFLRLRGLFAGSGEGGLGLVPDGRFLTCILLAAVLVVWGGLGLGRGR